MTKHFGKRKSNTTPERVVKETSRDLLLFISSISQIAMFARSKSVFLSSNVTRLASGNVPRVGKFLGARHFGIIGDTVTKMASSKMEGDKGSFDVLH